MMTSSLRAMAVMGAVASLMPSSHGVRMFRSEPPRLSNPSASRAKRKQQRASRRRNR